MTAQPSSAVAVSPAPHPGAGGLLGMLRHGNWFDPRRLRVMAIAMALAGFAAYGHWLLGTTHGFDPDTLKPVAADFTSFWIAARTVVAGTPALAYDLAAHTQAQLQALPYPPGATVPVVTWSYPPTFLLLVAPFGLLPLNAAFALWMLATNGLFLFAVRRVAPPTRGRLPELLALGFAGLQVNLQYGQNGALTAGLFGLGLLWLQQRPWLAGACFALLTCKPQLGILLPLALLAGRQYRVLATAGLCAVGLAALSALALGAGTWPAFLGTLGWSRDALLDQGATVWSRMPSLFAAARLWGLALPAAYAVQAASSLAAALLVWRLWRGDAGPPARNAGLLAATLAATPYLLNYDLMLLGMALAWAARLGLSGGFPPWLPVVMVLCWFAPAFSVLATPWAVPLVPALGLVLAALLQRTAVLRLA